MSTPTVPTADIDAAVAAMMDEITDDVEFEVVPIDVADFSALHAHVDANMYADDQMTPLWDADLLVGDGQGYPNVNAVQDRVDQWIKTGGLRLAVSTRAWNRLTAEERRDLEAEGLRAVPVPHRH